MRRTALAVSITALMVPLAGVGQEPATPDRTAVIKAAQEVAAQARFCSFITLDETGQPNARIIDLFPLDDDLTAWIGTSAAMRKVAQVRHDPRATLLCFDPQNSAYVTLIGTAEVLTDAASKTAHWKPEWTQYYRDENRGEDYVLIRLRPASVEIVSQAHGFPIAFRPTTLKLR